MTNEAPPLLPEPSRDTGEPTGPVECLGKTFASEGERREHYLARLRELLPELRKRPDFPNGSDDDILRMSDPPWYTACPNPFLGEFVQAYGRPYDPAEPYHREPFAVDVSVGKTHPLYRAHGYHTKVPHLAIVPSILHYTKPGDLVLDGFCGSGMTGVAAQWCGTAPAEYRRTVEAEWQAAGRKPPEWGVRRAILGDLSPAATFIAANYNIPFDVDEFASAAQRLLDEVEEEIGWMYETRHTDGTNGRINYTVWSEVFACPECAAEIVFVEEALDRATGTTRSDFPCPQCAAALSKTNLQRSFEILTDSASRTPWRRIRLRPVFINYTAAGHRFEKQLDSDDVGLLNRIDSLPAPSVIPTAEFPIEDMGHGSRLAPKGFTHVHHVFLPRPAHALGTIWSEVNSSSERRVRNALFFLVEQAIWNLSMMNAYRPTGFSQNSQWLKGVYYVPSQHSECSIWYVLRNKLNRLKQTFNPTPSKAQAVAISVSDCSTPTVSQQTVDYIFTDPPFGENIPYADLNYVVESWHGVTTSSRHEAAVDRAKGKKLLDYQHLMQRCFEEYHRVLKPGRWMTVVFHNSRNAVWNSIQEAMVAAGFVVADVRTLDKKQGSFRQVTSTAVKQDLVISAYKPNGGLEERFRLSAGTEDGAWEFVRTHLRQLPVFAEREGRSEVMQERQDFLLFDRMVAFHVQRGAAVPLSAAEFYAGLRKRFPERDGMFFLAEQVPRYDKGRFRAKGLFEPGVVVRDEETAIRWLRAELKRKPQTFQELHPKFIREIGGWSKHEAVLELSRLLEENFLCYEGDGPVPNPIHAYLSTAYKDLRNLAKGRVGAPTPGEEPLVHPGPHEGPRNGDAAPEGAPARVRQVRLGRNPPAPGRTHRGGAGGLPGSLAREGLRDDPRRGQQDPTRSAPRGSEAPHVVRPGAHPQRSRVSPGASVAATLRKEILSRCPAGVSRITLADDPDELLREAGVLARLEESGFDVLFFDDPVTFRFAYETRFRAAWDRGEKLELLVAHGGDETSLPFDLTAGARRVSLRLDDFFPVLSSAVVRELDPTARDRLFAVQDEAGRKPLGDDETRDFVLRHLFGIEPKAIRGPADLLALLLERHHGGRQVPPSLDDRLIRRLRRKKGLTGWPLQPLLTDREAFLAFVQERWPLFLTRRAGNLTEGRAEKETLAVPGPPDIPFEQEKVRVYLDTLFVEGFLRPVEHPYVPGPKEAWIGAGILGGGADATRGRLEPLLEAARSGVPTADADHRAWLRFARLWAETRAVLLALDDPPSDALRDFRQLEGDVDNTFAAWLPRRYGPLSSLPPFPPVMLHHVPHRLAQDMANGDRKTALLVLDGLALPQWVALREELTHEPARYSLREDAVFAWIPTITAVSRQAAFAGRPPFYFAGSINSTAREPSLWKAFWVSKGLATRNVGYAKGLGTAGPKSVETLLETPDLRAVGLVINTVDDIMHGMQLGERGMQNQVRQWARQPFLRGLLDQLLDRGFDVWLTSDHGNIEAAGCGSPHEGAVADVRGERVRTYSDQTLRNQVAAHFPEAEKWPAIGLPEDYLPLLAPGRRAFVADGKTTVCHGGAALEEVIVPLVRIGRGAR